jgi:hypothetical protein
VAKKFSLKDNPIFQRLTSPVPQEMVTPQGEDGHAEKTPEGQILTLKERPSEIDPQNFTSGKTSETAAPTPQEPNEPSPVAPLDPTAVDLEIQDHFDKTLFFSFYNEVADELLPTLDPAAQILYSRLFRLSYGFNRNYCTVSHPLLIERTGLSRNTVRTTLQSLMENGWIKIIGAGNRISTSYRVILPREKGKYAALRGAESDPQKLTLGENRGAAFEGQKMTLKNRGSEFAPVESQTSDLQNLTPRDEEINNSHYDNQLEYRGPKFEGQNLPPLLRSLTNRSLTLSEREFEGRNLTLRSQILSARELVDKFYSLLGQRATKAKRVKSAQECLGLLQEGFTVEEMDYAISWLVTHHPTTGSFSRLAHFIDQALKERQAALPARELSYQQTLNGEREQADRQRREEEAQQQRRIEEAKASLSSERLTELREEAQQLVKQENPNIRFGEDILIQLKIDELISRRYL